MPPPAALPGEEQARRSRVEGPVAFSSDEDSPGTDAAFLQLLKNLGGGGEGSTGEERSSKAGNSRAAGGGASLAQISKLSLAEGDVAKVGGGAWGAWGDAMVLNGRHQYIAPETW
jgi:hypothetical protein